MINISITAKVDVHIHQDFTLDDISALVETLAKLKALAQKAKALAAKY